MTGNVVIHGVDALMSVALSRAKKHMPYMELVGTAEFITLQPKCRTNPGRYNRVQLYVVSTHTCDSFCSEHWVYNIAQLMKPDEIQWSSKTLKSTYVPKHRNLS